MRSTPTPADIELAKRIIRVREEFAPRVDPDRPLDHARFAEPLKVSRQAVVNWERGHGAGRASLKKVAIAYKVDFHWLATGEGEPRPSPLPFVIPEAGFTGRVGAGGSAINVEMDPDDAARRLPVLAGKVEVLRIAELDGPSLGAQFDRWLVVYGAPVTFQNDLPYGQLCLVLTVDDEMTAKWLSKSKKRGVKLIDAAGETYRDGVDLQWAAPVLGMRPK